MSFLSPMYLPMMNTYISTAGLFFDLGKCKRLTGNLGVGQAGGLWGGGLASWILPPRQLASPCSQPSAAGVTGVRREEGGGGGEGEGSPVSTESGLVLLLCQKRLRLSYLSYSRFRKSKKNTG